MEDELISVLSSLGYPVFLQGSLLPSDGYPNHFFTFWNYTSSGAGFYDNDEHAIIYEYRIFFYSVEPSKVYSVLMEAKDLLKQNGWIVTGAGYSVKSDEPTHTGRAITIIYRRQKHGD